MGSLISFIKLMIVSLLQLQLTHSASPENESSDPLVGSCRQSSFLIDFLQRTLPTLQYPGNAFIFTDCLSSFDFLELKSLSTYSPFAIVDVSFLNQANISIFCETKAIVVLDLSETYIGHATKMIFKIQQYTHKREVEWQPTISIIWKSALDTEEQLSMLQIVFNSTTLYFNTNIFIFFLEPSSSSIINVWEVYKIKQKKFFAAVNSFSTKEWTNSSSVGRLQPFALLEDLESYAKRRRNFHLESLAASVKFDPNFQDWVGVGMKDDGSYILTGGYIAVLYWDLRLLMNFSEQILLGDSPQFFSNGTLAGITVGQLNSGEIDLFLNQVSFSQQRAKAFTFLQPTYNSLTYVFFKQPSTNSIRDVVIAAFEKELWIALIGVWAILVISTKVRLTLTFLLKNSPFLPQYTFPSRGDDQKFANESVLWSVAVFCQKTWHLDPASFSLRMKFLIGCFVGFLSYTAYSGSIVSSLAVNKIPVKNFADLINFNFIFTVHEQSESYQTMLKGLIKFYSLAQEVKTVSTLKEVSHLYVGSSSTEVESSKNALLSPADMFYKTAAHLNYSSFFICDQISSFSAGTYSSKSAMLVKKTSQFKEVLNLMLVYLRQRGHIYRNIDSYNTPNFLKCIPKDEQGSKAVDPATWIDLFTIFLILFIGFLSAALLLILEIVCICYCNWKSRRENYINNILHDGEWEWYN